MPNFALIGEGSRYTGFTKIQSLVKFAVFVAEQRALGYNDQALTWKNNSLSFAKFGHGLQVQWVWEAPKV